MVENKWRLVATLILYICCLILKMLKLMKCTLDLLLKSVYTLINGRENRNPRTRRATLLETLKGCIYGGVSVAAYLIITLVGGLITSL